MNPLLKAFLITTFAFMIIGSILGLAIIVAHNPSLQPWFGGFLVFMVYLTIVGVVYHGLTYDGPDDNRRKR